MLERYTATIVFKVKPDYGRKVIDKVLNFASDAYGFDSFAIRKYKGDSFLASIISSENVCRKFINYISQLNLSVLPDQPRGAIEVEGMIITKN